MIELNDDSRIDISNEMFELTKTVIGYICNIADYNNLDRDDTLRYFSNLLKNFTEIVTIKNYSKATTDVAPVIHAKWVHAAMAIDINYFLYKPKSDKDIPVFVRTDTGEECRPHYDEKGYLQYFQVVEDFVNVCVKYNDGRTEFVDTKLLTVKNRHD